MAERQMDFDIQYTIQNTKDCATCTPLNLAMNSGAPVGMHFLPQLWHPKQIKKILEYYMLHLIYIININKAKLQMLGSHE